eukprot:s1540_g2.t1
MVVKVAKFASSAMSDVVIQIPDHQLFLAIQTARFLDCQTYFEDYCIPLILRGLARDAAYRRRKWRHPLDEPSNCNQQALQRALSELENPMQRDELCRALQRTVQYRLPCGTRVLVTSDPDECEAELRLMLESPGLLGLDAEWADGRGKVARHGSGFRQTFAPAAPVVLPSS